MVFLQRLRSAVLIPADHNAVKLGNSSVRLEATGVSFLPSRLRQARGAQQVDVPYSTIVKVTMTEPQGLAHGILTVRLSSGDIHAVPFGRSRLREVRRTQREIWLRARAARDDEGQVPPQL